MQHLNAQLLAHPNGICAAFLFGFWLFIYLAIKISHLIARRPWSDGPSFIPVVPLLLIISIAIAASLNAFLTPYGTVFVIVVHFAWLISGILKLRRKGN